MPATTQAELKAARAQPGNRFFRYWCSDRADLDGDRRPDAVCGGFGGYGGSAMGRYLIAGTDGTLVEKGAALGLPREGAPVLVADLNDDGVDDVLVAGAREGGAFLSSSGRFAAADSALSRFLRQRGSYLQRIVAEDLDQDGDLDLVASLPREKQVVVFENLGKGAFREVATAEGWDAEPIAVADVDGDGLLDVCVGGPGETITILANRTKAPGRGLQIDLRMPSPNPFAVGALVEVWRPGERDQPRTRPRRPDASAPGRPSPARGTGYARHGRSESALPTSREAPITHGGSHSDSGRTEGHGHRPLIHWTDSFALSRDGTHSGA